ncbi:MAG: hypothetical protein HFH68_09240 [Lachnospiraceae bacterium]|nr:hypothetical protein [Lachnospiraceae bacterium]
MKVGITNKSTEYIINLEPVTQLCGVSFEKKNFIIKSLYKYFSSSKYEQFEENMHENIKINDEKTGRKYFSTFHVSTREQLIQSLKISKSSLMNQYLAGMYSEIPYQWIIDQIQESLDKLYLEINKEIQNKIGCMEIGHYTKNILEIIQSSDISGTNETALENLPNMELLSAYIRTLQEIQRKYPCKTLIIIENADHLVSYNDYKKLLNTMEEFCNNSDVWFIITTSTEGYVVLNENLIEGVNVINDCIFSFPDMEHIISFIRKRYPVENIFTEMEICENIIPIIQNIGCENYKYDMRKSVMLKLLQNSLGIPLTFKNIINSIEKAFLSDKNML